MFHVKQYKDYTSNDWAKLSGNNWYWLLRSQPQFSTHCDWEKLNGEFNDGNWYWLFTVRPQYSIHCDWEKFDGFSWCYLLGGQPHFEPIGECFS
jgi:hypothetical protein